MLCVFLREYNCFVMSISRELIKAKPAGGSRNLASITVIVAINAEQKEKPAGQSGE